MPNVKCGYSACKHNTSLEPNVMGTCMYDGEIKLIYKMEEFTDEEGDFQEIEGLDCNKFEMYIDKFTNKDPNEI